MLVGLLITWGSLGSCQRVSHTHAHTRARKEKSSLFRLSGPFHTRIITAVDGAAGALNVENLNPDCCRKCLPSTLIWPCLESFHKLHETCLAQESSQRACVSGWKWEARLYNGTWCKMHWGLIFKSVQAKRGKFVVQFFFYKFQEKIWTTATNWTYF